MALLPDVHVNVDRPTIQHIYQLFLPFAPGGTLVIGLAWTHAECLGRFVVAYDIGYYSQVAAMVFLAYVAGLMLYVASVHFASILSLLASVLCGKIARLRPNRPTSTMSQNHVWRTVANAFLGSQLAPTPPPPPVGGGLFTTSAYSPQPTPPIVQQYDTDWNDWYIVLQDYLLRSTPILAPDVYFLFTTVQGVGWAVLIVSFQSGLASHHLFALVVTALLVVLTALVQFGSTYFYLKFDRLMAADFVARLLAEIRAK